MGHRETKETGQGKLLLLVEEDNRPSLCSKALYGSEERNKVQKCRNWGVLLLRSQLQCQRGFRQEENIAADLLHGLVVHHTSLPDICTIEAISVCSRCIGYCAD